MAAAEREATSAKLNLSIADMTEHDLVEVCEIEEISELSAWGWDAYHKELQSPDAIMLVARVDPIFQGVETAGFIVASLILDELHVNNVAVRPEFRRYRVGLHLLKEALAEAEHRGAAIAHLEVRAKNVAAQGLYQRCGFAIVGRRKNYYRHPTEDALLMTLPLRSSS